jgi:Cu(I)/Ag(I) efflux system membrane protein CusA/SilA
MMINSISKYFLENRWVALLLLAVVMAAGLATAPFDAIGRWWPVNDPVPVDAIPDVGENQQIVATEWMGRSAKDVQDQVTYPLTTALMGVPGVKTIRSTSMFGMSFIYVIFEDAVEFYWSRSRILEKLNSLPSGVLPSDAQPTLGPDATALGQVLWYTLEGRDPKTGAPTGGWDASELRSIQDFHVKYALSTAGVAEVASVGGFVKEYQVEMDPDAMQAHGVTVMEVMAAVEKSNLDVGAETLELNKVEYVVRGLGYIRSIADLEESVVAVRSAGAAPVRIRDVARVMLGPAPRRGGLDKEGVEAVGGVIVARYGANPMEVIAGVKARIAEVSAGLPEKVLADGRTSKVTVVPFYDRSGLIRETIGTLETALGHEILICIIVVIVLVLNLRASVVIAGLLPVATLAAFVLMRYTHVDANIVALSGIAIAIGVMVDVGVVIVESILRKMKETGIGQLPRGKAGTDVVYAGVREISGALSTGMLTTIISFLPVFAMEAQEGKLFRPLAFTKTYALVAAFVLGVALLPTVAYYVLSWKTPRRVWRWLGNGALIVGGVAAFVATGVAPALGISLLGIHYLTAKYWRQRWVPRVLSIGIVLVMAVAYLTAEWLPVGTGAGFSTNVVFVVGAIGLILGALWALVVFYERILRGCLAHRWLFMSIPVLTLALGGWIWRGMGEEFMPSLDEGSFLLMPTSMPHTGIEQNREWMGLMDRRVSAIPEVESCVGKWGRINSALDPAPVQMFENMISYRPEFLSDANGRRMRFKVDAEGGFVLKDGSRYRPEEGFRILPVDSLVTDRRGKFFRQWRPEIRTADDIWTEIVRAAEVPGMTSAPRLQPIAARLVMLSTGMRAPMGVKIAGPDLESIEAAGVAIEAALKELPSVAPSTVFYDRAVGAPYIEIHLDRVRMARYGMTVVDVQEVIGAAIGGMPLTTTVEGRERVAVRVRYPRELREDPEALAGVLVPTATGVSVPLGEVAEVEYRRGAQMIQSENTFLTGYVIFDKHPGRSEGEVVREAGEWLEARMASGEIRLPAGVSYVFAGNYEQQLRAERRLLVILPVCLLAIFVVLYFRFGSLTASAIHFSGVLVAFAGGFILLWLYGQGWFMNFEVGGANVRGLFGMHPVYLSVAVWVGFIALFGIATNDGVLMGTYIHELFLERQPQTRTEIRETVVQAGLKRVRPAAMTTATTLIALLPVLTSTGKGADIMVPMAIPTFGGMLIQSMTMFIVPVLQCWWREWRVKKEGEG